MSGFRGSQVDVPCSVEDIPPIDIIVISHNHYDHMDTFTLGALIRKDPKHIPHVFAPLGNAYFLTSIGFPGSHVHILDWWQKAGIILSSVDATAAPETFTLTCTPCQHNSGRGITDQYKSLWASWMLTTPTPLSSCPAHIYFAGDTGYRAVDNVDEEETAPYCPAFEEIGERFGEVAFAMIPIGAYEPRWFMSPIHLAPQDSVCVFRDLRARRAVGMHWGAFRMTTEDVLEPPKRLEEECRKAGIEDGTFFVCGIGETVFV